MRSHFREWGQWGQRGLNLYQGSPHASGREPVSRSLHSEASLELQQLFHGESGCAGRQNSQSCPKWAQRHQGTRVINSTWSPHRFPVRLVPMTCRVWVCWISTWAQAQSWTAGNHAGALYSVPFSQLSPGSALSLRGANVEQMGWKRTKWLSRPEREMSPLPCVAVCVGLVMTRVGMSDNWFWLRGQEQERSGGEARVRRAPIRLVRSEWPRFVLGSICSMTPRSQAVGFSILH